jgi:hypothetical protein
MWFIVAVGVTKRVHWGHCDCVASSLTQRCLGAGVRARQERVPFVTCEDGGLLDSVVRPLLGKRVRLQAGAQGVLLSADDDSDAAAGSASSSGAAAAAAHTASAERTVTKASCFRSCPGGAFHCCEWLWAEHA